MSATNPSNPPAPDTAPPRPQAAAPDAVCANTRGDGPGPGAGNVPIRWHGPSLLSEAAFFFFSESLCNAGVDPASSPRPELRSSFA